MSRRLLVTRSEVSNVTFTEVGAFRMRIDVTDPSQSGTDTHVLLFNQRPSNPHEADDVADFIGVASVPDLAEYPIGQPTDSTTYPIFRLSSVTLDFLTLEMANEVYQNILAEISALIVALNKFDTLESTSHVWIGGEPDSGSSSSASSSTSV